MTWERLVRAQQPVGTLGGSDWRKGFGSYYLEEVDLTSSVADPQESLQLW